MDDRAALSSGISCGEVLLSDNFSSNISLYDYSECVSVLWITFPDLPDQLYRFELADQQTSGLQDYTGAGCYPSWKVMSITCPVSCIDQFFRALPDNQEVISVLDPGVYWIVFVNGFRRGYVPFYRLIVILLMNPGCHHLWGSIHRQYGG